MSNARKILGAAFGNPKDEKTYSGVSKYLFNAIEEHADVVAYVSTKQLRPWDIFNGAVDFSKTFKFGRPGINTNWLWRRKTLDKLSARLRSHLLRVGEFDTVLQMGTHARVEINGIRHYCRTDMTVVQGVEAKQFSVAKLQGPRIPEAIEMQKSIFENCDGIFATSNWVKQSIVVDYGINPDKVHVIGAGASFPEIIEVSDKTPNSNILFIGRDWKRKGGPFLLDAFRRIRKSFPEAKLTVIGCSPSVHEPNIEVLGHLDKTNEQHKLLIKKAFLDATILCVPSTFEPFGMCWLEAQLQGVVPVTFAGEGRGEAIKDGITGVLVKDRSPEALSETILALLDNPDQTRQMGIRGHRFIKDNFTWDHVASRILKVIETNR